MKTENEFDKKIKDLFRSKTLKVFLGFIVFLLCCLGCGVFWGLFEVIKGMAQFTQ
jgi:hypothetical protein